MKINELKPSVGAKSSKKRVGRGQASGLGKTAGRGMDGQNSRSGGGVRIGFEGGQMPLYRRIPKRGFSNFRFRKNYAIVNLSSLNGLGVDTVTPEILLERKIIKKLKDGVKILANGTLDEAITVKAHKFTKSAIEKIEEAGGKAEVI